MIQSTQKTNKTNRPFIVRQNYTAMNRFPALKELAGPIALWAFLPQTWGGQKTGKLSLKECIKMLNEHPIESRLIMHNQNQQRLGRYTKTLDELWANEPEHYRAIMERGLVERRAKEKYRQATPAATDTATDVSKAIADTIKRIMAQQVRT
jgi:hypothetical protein